VSEPLKPLPERVALAIHNARYHPDTGPIVPWCHEAARAAVGEVVTEMKTIGSDGWWAAFEGLNAETTAIVCRAFDRFALHVREEMRRGARLETNE